MDDKITIIVADTSAQEPDSYLARLEKLSQERGDGGMLHGGHIHFIQGKLSNEDGFPFLKAAIVAILDRVPSIFPYDLPERAEKADGDLDATPEQVKAFNEINRDLIIPIDPWDIIRVILAGREYEQMAADNENGNSA